MQKIKQLGLVSLIAILAPAAVAVAGDTPASQLGKWKFNAGASNQGSNPNPVVEATLHVTTDDGKALQFTLLETMKDGHKQEYKWNGSYDGKLRPGSDIFSVGYEHAPGGWKDRWEMTGGPAKGMKGYDECTLATDGRSHTCRGGIDGQPPSYTLVYEKIADR